MKDITTLTLSLAGFMGSLTMWAFLLSLGRVGILFSFFPFTLMPMFLGIAAATGDNMSKLKGVRN